MYSLIYGTYKGIELTSMEKIPYKAFYGVTADDCNLPNTTELDVIGELSGYCFAYTNIKDVIMESFDGTGTLSLFSDSNIENLYLPSVKALESYAFSSLSFETLELSDELTIIPRYAFSNATIQTLIAPGVDIVYVGGFKGAVIENYEFSKSLCWRMFFSGCLYAKHEGCFLRKRGF